MASLKSDVGLFSRLYIGCQTREGNLEEFFCHENQAYPPSISDGSNLYQGTKSDLLTCLKEVSELHPDTPAVTSLIVDGAVIVQMLKPNTAKNFSEYATNIFIPYIRSQVQKFNVSRLDLVWDRYIPDSLKSITRAKRGCGARRHVVAKGAIPQNWQSFLRDDYTSFSIFLLSMLYDSFLQQDKELIYNHNWSNSFKQIISRRFRVTFTMQSRRS